MDNLLIIKIGGNVIDQPGAMATFMDDYVRIAGKKILIHGGGKITTDISRPLGIEAQMVDGRRITDKETLKVVTMVYGGLINKMIVSGLQARGVNAIGLTGADADVISAKKREDKKIDYVISKGMLPKFEQTFAALQAGVAAMILCHAAQLSLAVPGDASVGTSLIL